MSTDLQSKLAATREDFEAELATKRAERDNLAREQKKELEELMRTHQKALSGVDGELQMLVGVVTALNGQAKLPKPKNNRRPPPPRASATGHGISIETAIAAAEAIDQIVEEKGENGFTQRELYRKLDWDQAKGSAAVRYLRSIGHLRKAGVSGRAELWAVMDREAINREASMKGVLEGAGNNAAQ